MKAPTEARPHQDAKYCWTCKRSIAPSHWGRQQNSAAHGRRVLGIPHPDERPVKTQHGNPVAEADTQPQCGGCSQRIKPGHAYWRDDGCAYHNGCVPLATTRPLDPTQTAQAAPQQASTLVAEVRVQLGAGKGEEAPYPTPASDDQGKPERPLARLARERREARDRHA